MFSLFKWIYRLVSFFVLLRLVDLFASFVGMSIHWTLVFCVLVLLHFVKTYQLLSPFKVFSKKSSLKVLFVFLAFWGALTALYFRNDSPFKLAHYEKATNACQNVLNPALERMPVFFKIPGLLHNELNSACRYQKLRRLFVRSKKIPELCSYYATSSRTRCYQNVIEDLSRKFPLTGNSDAYIIRLTFNELAQKEPKQKLEALSLAQVMRRLSGMEVMEKKLKQRIESLAINGDLTPEEEEALRALDYRREVLGPLMEDIKKTLGFE